MSHISTSHNHLARYDGVATISRLLKIIGLFCKRALQNRRYCAKETYHFHDHLVRHDGVANISRSLKIIGFFCKRALWKRLYSAQETHNIKEPTNCSHPIRISRLLKIIGLLSRIYSLFYRALLQKRPVMLRGLLIVATPYVFAWVCMKLWFIGIVA